MTHTLAQIFAVTYILFGLFGLLVVSIPSNREEMFLEKERPWVGWLRAGNAYLVLLTMVTCGAAVWFAPAHVAQTLAWVALAAILAAKAVGLIFGERYSCKRCMLIGSLVAIVATLVIVAGVSSGSAA